MILVETLRRLREEKKHGPESISLQRLNVSDAAVDATRILPQPCSVIGSHELTRTLPAFPDQPSVDAMVNPDLRMWTAGAEVTDTEQAERGAFADWMELACPAESCERFCCPLHGSSTQESKASLTVSPRRDAARYASKAGQTSNRPAIGFGGQSSAKSGLFGRVLCRLA